MHYMTSYTFWGHFCLVESHWVVSNYQLESMGQRMSLHIVSSDANNITKTLVIFLWYDGNVDAPQIWHLKWNFPPINGYTATSFLAGRVYEIYQFIIPTELLSWEFGKVPTFLCFLWPWIIASLCIDLDVLGSPNIRMEDFWSSGHQVI